MVSAEGQTKHAKLLAKARKEFNTTAWDAHFVETKDGNYYESKIFEDYAVLTIKMFANENENKFDGFLADFFEKLKAEKIDHLIIDLRGNFGGDSFLAKELLSYLTTQKFDYISSELPFYYRWLGFMKPVTPKDNLPNLEVVVLTDGAVFSTAAHFTALMKYHQLGTVVGAETGGTYICTDGSKDVALKNTRLRLHYSTQLFKVKVKGMSENSGVTPDIEVRPSIEDILKNKDVVMEAGVGQFK
ncbi:MAG: S41 family peptidase [Bacillus sp. (in: firmicutes)]